MLRGRERIESRLCGLAADTAALPEERQPWVAECVPSAFDIVRPQSS
jgi:hypothetical protein